MPDASALSGVMKTQFVFNLLGYALYNSLFTCLVLALVIRALPLTDYTGLPKVNENFYYLGFTCTAGTSASFWALCNVGL